MEKKAADAGKPDDGAPGAASAQTKAKRHTIPESLKPEHDAKRTRDGSGKGACLWPHADSRIYTTGDSCSYRWQAHTAARLRHRDIFDNVTSARVPQRWKKRIRPCSRPGAPPGLQELNTVPLPQEDDWNLDGPTRQATLLALFKGERKAEGGIRNFATNAQWPYPFNAHHLLPKGLFSKTLETTAREKAKDKAGILVEAVQSALLRAGYSIHHERNMIPLPCHKTVAVLLRLPRHLTKAPLGKFERENLIHEPTSHTKYDLWVEDLLTPVITRLVNAVANCTDADITANKNELEQDVSDKCRSEITSYGKNEMGHPLAALSLGTEV